MILITTFDKILFSKYKPAKIFAPCSTFYDEKIQCLGLLKHPAKHNIIIENMPKYVMSSYVRFDFIRSLGYTTYTHLRVWFYPCRIRQASTLSMTGGSMAYNG